MDSSGVGISNFNPNINRLTVKETNKTKIMNFLNEISSSHNSIYRNLGKDLLS